jgi:myo-inositol-hexaphosphate 3-phosphohydrolase
VALARNADGGFEVWADTSSPTIEHFTLSAVVDGGVTFTALTPITVPEPPAGLAVDDRTGRLYVSLQTMGVFTVDRSGNSSFLISIDAGHLGSVIGGIDLFLVADGGTLVFTASPSEVALEVHSVSGSLATFRTALQIGMTDGGPQLGQPHHLDVYERPVPGFPKGVLIVQDELTANYKLVSLAAVDAVFPLPDPWIPGGAPATLDSGVDAGADGGSDGGSPGDGGIVDGGAPGADGGGGRPPGPAPGVEPAPTCGCTGGPFAALPALLLLWWIRRLRS